MPYYAIETLVEYAMGEIVNSFEEFLYLYQSDNRFDKHFEFLQRQYSDELLEHFMMSGTLQNEFLPFLLNRHLNTLTVYSSSDLDVDLLLTRLTIMGDSITELNLKETDFTEELVLFMIPCIPNVEKIDLPYRLATDEILKAAGLHCPYLSALDLPSRSMTGIGLRSLVRRDDKGFPILNINLTELCIEKARLVEDDLVFLLNHCPNLQTLEHHLLVPSLYNKHKERFSRREAVPKYKLKLLRISLSKYSCKYEVMDLMAAVFPLVKILTVRDLCPRSVLECSKFERLNKVDLHSRKSNDYTAFLEARGRSLINFTAYNGNICVKTLGKCSKLRGLNFYNVKFNGSGSVSSSAAGGAFPDLNIASFNQVDFSKASRLEAACFVLLNSPELVYLCFDHCRSFKKAVLPLLIQGKITNARKLSFHNLDLNASSVKRLLASIRGHKVISIKSCNMSAIKCKNLCSFVKRRKLDVDFMCES